jgi:hypothetical protein
VAQETPFETWVECLPDDGGAPWQVVHDWAGGEYVQDCVRTGVPVQPAGNDVAVRVCVPLD